MSKTYVICSFIARKNEDLHSLVVLGSSDVETIAYQMAIDLEKIHKYYEDRVHTYQNTMVKNDQYGNPFEDFEQLGIILPWIMKEVPEELSHVKELYTAIMYDNLLVDGYSYQLKVKPNFSFKNSNFFYAPVDKY